MKKILIIVLLGLLTFVACNKMSNNNSDNNSETSLVEKAVPVEKIYTYSCSGTCANGSDCTITQYFNPPAVECDCEACVLNVTVSDPDKSGNTLSSKELKQILFSKKLFQNELLSHVQKEYNTSSYKLTLIILTEYGNDYTLMYEYVVEDTHLESVMYAHISGNSKEPPKEYQIDCNGSCDEPSETCRERFNFNPPSAECTCESDNCNMNIIEL